jgi:hypothetical protein
MTSTSIPRYPEYKSYDSENFLEDLEKYGVAVIENVVPLERCQIYQEQLTAEVKKLTSKMKVPLDCDNPDTYRTMFDLFPQHAMLLQYFGIGHTQTSWDVRQEEGVWDAFARIHKDEDLLVSFDGLSIHFPPEITKRGYFRGKILTSEEKGSSPIGKDEKGIWLHTDQKFSSNDYCIQGMVTLRDVNEGDASLCVIEGSHKYHQELGEKFKLQPKIDWYKLNDEEMSFLLQEKRLPIKIVKAKAGSLILWNSKTFHQGIESRLPRANPTVRMVIYVCMTPRKWAKKKDLLKKVKAFEEMRTTSHWPHRVKLFGKAPRTYGKMLPDVTPLERPILSEHGRRLAGYEQ